MSAKFSSADEHGNINVTYDGSNNNSSSHGGNPVNMASVLSHGLKAIETQIDAELNHLNNLNEDDLTRIRRSRIAELKNRSAKESEWVSMGHGSYSEIGDQKEWFNEAKTNEVLITHFYRPQTWRCELVDKHFATLVKKHLEAKFIKLDAEKSPYLCERFNIVVLPAIVVSRDNKVLCVIEGFDEFGGNDDFTTSSMESYFIKKGALDMIDDGLEIKKQAQGRDKEDGKSSIRQGGDLKGKKVGGGVKGMSNLSFNRRTERESDDEASDDD